MDDVTPTIKIRLLCYIETNHFSNFIQLKSNEYAAQAHQLPEVMC